MCEELLGPNTQVYSLKPLVGHCQSTASAVEMAVTLLGHERRLVPAPLPVAAAQPRLPPVARPPGVTVKTSLGLGGNNFRDRPRRSLLTPAATRGGYRTGAVLLYTGLTRWPRRSITTAA